MRIFVQIDMSFYTKKTTSVAFSAIVAGKKRLNTAQASTVAEVQVALGKIPNK